MQHESDKIADGVMLLVEHAEENAELPGRGEVLEYIYEAHNRVQAEVHGYIYGRLEDEAHARTGEFSVDEEFKRLLTITRGM